MKRTMVDWAKAHDWYLSSEQLPIGPGIWDGGEWEVTVRDYDEQGNPIKISFESFIELSRWAGY